MEELELNSRSYFLWNNSLGIAVGGTEVDTPTAVASLTKMMTALVVLENRDLSEQVVITPEMLSGLYEYAVIGLQVGQTVTVEDLLYATLLPSAGDAAQALAISTSGSIAEFAELMNARAESIGMTETHFSNPVGMDEENYSTPRNIALLVREALNNSTFVEIFETYEKYLLTIGKTAQKTFVKQGYIKGGKTGYTEAAGRCLASTAEIEGTEYILVTIGADPGQNTVDTNKIYDWVKESYEPVQILTTGEKILQVGVKGSPVQIVEFVAERDVMVALENGVSTEDLAYEYDGVDEITAETELGAKLGVVRVRYGETELYAQEVYYNEMPEFYNYHLVALGGVVSGGLLLGAVIALILGGKRRRVRWLKKLAGVLLALGIVSLGVNYWLFHDWFGQGGETQVIRPETLAVEVVETESESVVEEPVESEPEPEVDEAVGGNCTTNWGDLMLINPNFTVDLDFIANRKQQMISVSQNYGIPEYHVAGNGDNLMDAEAAKHLGEMVAAYKAYNPGHEMGTYSCFRSRGTQCGRLCAATGASDHHTGLTCDLIDLQYGTELDSDDYPNHIEWQWLRENSYKYGFIDRFPEEWAGGSMLEPLNVDANGSTGLYETWHYRYVGVTAATEIATGKYNDGRYDSLEHYLKATGKISDLKNGVCR